jgi:RNA polymerase sigma factor (sigma-70 family)
MSDPHGANLEQYRSKGRRTSDLSAGGLSASSFKQFGKGADRMRLDDERCALIEENMGLVGRVIKDKVRDAGNVGIFTRDDLFQIGCMGLCKAAASYRPGVGRFSTYAYVSIRNEIFSALEYATLRKKRESVTDPNELPGPNAPELPDGVSEELSRALDAAYTTASGVTAKGVMAIRLLALGYTHREIGERMGASANNVSAWVARARKYLRTRPDIVALGKPS